MVPPQTTPGEHASAKLRRIQTVRQPTTAPAHDRPAVAAREYVCPCGAMGIPGIAVQLVDVIGYVTIIWESNYAGFRRRGIPLIHQIAVAGPSEWQGVATLLMDAAEQLVRDRGIATLGITVGLFDEYGPAQQLYGRRGYIYPTAGVHAGASDRSAKACR